MNPPHQTPSPLPAARLRTAKGEVGNEVFPRAAHIRPNNCFFHPPHRRSQAARVQVAHVLGKCVNLKKAARHLFRFVAVSAHFYRCKDLGVCWSAHVQLHLTTVSCITTQFHPGDQLQKGGKIDINVKLSLCKLPGKYKRQQLKCVLNGLAIESSSQERRKRGG